MSRIRKKPSKGKRKDFYPKTQAMLNYKANFDRIFKIKREAIADLERISEEQNTAISDTSNIKNRLAELEALADAATPGPWQYDAGAWGRSDNISLFAGEDFLINISEGNSECMAFGALRTNVEFIAASREAVPWLIAELRKARAMMQEYAKARCDEGANAIKARRELYAALGNAKPGVLEIMAQCESTVRAYATPMSTAEFMTATMPND